MNEARLVWRSDALERARVREDGILCGCCAFLRLPDHYFPAMLGAGTPPPRRRCALCIQFVRQNHDLFGRPFFTPPNFHMPTPTPEDEERLTELVRCPSCASMRHRSLLCDFPGAQVFDSLYPYGSGRVLRAPVPPTAPRGPTPVIPLCVFCRRDQRRARAQPEPEPPGTSTTHLRHPPDMPNPPGGGSPMPTVPTTARPPATAARTMMTSSDSEGFPCEATG